MKRYNTYYPDMFEDEEGEWVKADIAIEMYEALRIALAFLKYNAYGQEYTEDIIRQVLQKARGE